MSARAPTRLGDWKACLINSIISVQMRENVGHTQCSSGEIQVVSHRVSWLSSVIPFLIIFPESICVIIYNKGS